MSERPTDTAEWATDANYPAGAEPEAGSPNKETPIPALVDTGWRPSEYPPAEIFNWLINMLCRWVVYLDERPARNFFTMHQNWMAPMLATWLDTFAGASSSLVVIEPAADKPGPWLRLRVPGTDPVATFHMKLSEAFMSAPWNPDLFGVIEYEHDIADAAGLGTPYIVAHGIRSDSAPPDPAVDDQVVAIKNNISENWQFRTADGTTATMTDTGIEAIGVQKFRIEIYGSNDAGGARAKLYIDEVLAATHTTNLPLTDDLFAFTYVQSLAAAGNDDTYTSPFNVVLKHL